MNTVFSARPWTRLRRLYRRGRRANRLVLGVIMGVAILLRAEYLLQIEHNTDHAWPIAQGLATLDLGSFPLVGQGTSVLFASPPLTGYLYVPWLALARSPLAVYIFVIALNTLAVLLAYRAARTLIGSRRALIAAGLMAVNPWVIEYSRASWVQGLQPFLVTATAWLLWPVLMGHSRRPLRRTILALVLLTLTGQTYLLGFALVVPVVILLILFRHRVSWPGVGIGALIFAVAFAIYGVGLFSEWNTVQQRVETFSDGPARVRPDAWNHAVRLVTGSDYELARGLDAPLADSGVRHDFSVVIHWLLLAVLGFGIAAAIYCAVRGGARPDGEVSDSAGPYCRRDAAMIALMWFVTPILMMTYVGQAVHPFYLLLSLPAGYVLAAWGLGVIFRPERRPGGPLLAALAIPFAIVMGLNSARYYQETAALPGAHGLTALSLEYGLPLGQALRDARPPDGIVFTDVQGWILNSLAGQTFGVMDEARAPGFTLVPAEGGVYVKAYPPGEDPAHPAASTLAARLDLPDGVTLAVDAFATDAASVCQTGVDAALMPGPLAIGYPSEQGITLAFAALDHTGDTWTLITAWEVTDAAVVDRAQGIDRHLYAPFAHVFDTGQEGSPRVLVVDGAAVPGYEWRAGDCHVHRMTFTLPEDGAGPFTLQAGQYDAIAGENVIFTEPGTGSGAPLVPLTFNLTR